MNSVEISYNKTRKVIMSNINLYRIIGQLLGQPINIKNNKRNFTPKIEKRCGPDRNRTCIRSFGNSYTIHCTTEPEK